MIRVRQLSIGFDGVPILSGLDFEVGRSEVFVILGGSGCGKSTLLRHLIGLSRPISGTIELELEAGPSGSGGGGNGENGDGGEGRPGFGVMFQSGALFSSSTLLENVALPLRAWTELGDEAVEHVALARLRLVGLGGFENHMPAEISGGMRKRAAIARALALDPPLLFLDEPSAGLDPVSSVELDDLIVLLRDELGVTSVIVTHELESVFRICDRCIMLDRGARGIVAEGDPRALRDESEDPLVHQFFNRLPGRTR